jgi:CheY-like chemotaxis protein
MKLPELPPDTAPTVREAFEVLARESAARRAAEEAVGLKDQFLATLSHELRTPMSAVLGWLHLLRTGKLKPEQSAQALETIERNARLQNQLINDLLDVSRIMTGQLRVECDRVHPSMIVEAAIDTVRLDAAARQIAITLALPETAPIVWADPLRLQQVFSNLLVNAVKFSPNGSQIDVTLHSTGDVVEVVFVDRGEGIAPEMLPLIFERFRQVDGSITRKHGGMGLGLAIARHIMHLHGGAVTAASEGLGRGATFTVTLPALAERITAGGVETQADADAPAPPESPLAGIHVLAVDDDRNALGMLASMLELGGAKVSVAPSADAAVASYAGNPDIDVLLSDIGMPGRDGYDLIATLRREFAERTKPLAAIAISGYARDEDHTRALRAGFDAHVAKPFGMKALFDVITRTVHQRHRQ